MAKIRPTEIKGPWRTGFVLDYQIVSSTFTGYDGFGHPQFDTVRTEMGDLLYRLKYRSDKSVIGEIVATVAEFLRARNWDPPISLIVPMPASRVRREQPVPMLARALGNQARNRSCSRGRQQGKGDATTQRCEGTTIKGFIC